MKQKFLNLVRSSFGVVLVAVVIIAWSAISYFVISYAKEDAGESTESESCNVYGVNIHGEIVTYHGNDDYDDQNNLIFDQTSADEVIWSVRQAEENDQIKAIVIEIDSVGGSPVAGEEMMQTLKQSRKPVVAYIRDTGVSAAYLAATGARTIFASKFSDVGSIGVTMSYLQETEKNEKEGLTYVDLSSGKYKDAGNPSRALSDDEKQVFMRDIKILHDYFVSLVSQNRKLDIEKVKKMADGSSMTGEAALKAGLVDRIGSSLDVKKFLSEKIGEKVDICWKN